MPFSNRELAPVIRRWCIENPNESMLDVGAGAGRYALELGDLFKRKIAVEVWEPYIGQFHLRDKYDEVILGDALKVDWPYADVVILGDVLEHFDMDDAMLLWGKAREHGVYVLLSLPIVPYPQGAEFGNPHEEHKVTWTHEMVMDLPGIQYCIGRGIELGAYIALGT